MTRSLGRVPFATRLAGRIFNDPMSYIPGKPLERWLMVVPLPERQLALSNDPAVVETVMLDRAGTYPKSVVLQSLLEPLVGTGVFGQPGGPAVKETRRIYARALAAIPDDRVRDVTRQIACGYIRRWLADRSNPLVVSEELSRLTVDVVSEATLGTRFTEAESTRFTRLFFDYQKRALPLVLMLATQREATRRRVVAEMGLPPIGGAMRQLMRDRFVAPLQSDPGAGPGLFPRALVEAGLSIAPGATGERVLDEIAVMLLAGHETTAASLSWLFYELSRDLQLQDDVAAAVCGEDVPRFKGHGADAVLDALAREALRLYPPIGFFLRDVTAGVTFREKEIPKGSFFVVAPWTLHRHRKLWSRPDAFAPERWLEDAAPSRTSYMPFGLGARICPGARFAGVEMGEILRLVLTHVRLEPAGRSHARPLGNLTTRPDREIFIRARPRHPLPEA